MLEVHLVEMTLLLEHRYSATLGYLKAAVAQDRELAAQVSLAGHVVYTADDALDAACDDVLAAMTDPGVLALTVYFWNRPQSFELARRVKERFPSCAVVVGGNDVTHQQDVVFTEAPWIDVLVHGEGELRFREVLRCVLADGPAAPGLAEVSGLSHRDAAGAVRTTRPAERITDLDEIPSPLLGTACTDDELAGTRMIIYETNRGCPYSCAFCYWGGYTNSKIRQFPLERIQAELDRIVRTVRPGTSVFVADANFGILGRDLEIARYFVERCRHYDKRVFLVTNWAKNTNSKVLEIATLLHENGLTGAITLAAQSFDEGTLEIARRSNIKVSNYRRLQQEFVRRGIPTYTDLIWGLPGESYESHLAGVEEVISAGGCPVVYPLLLLNNTEYTSTTFRAQHDVVVRELPFDVSNASVKTEVVVGHRAMTEQQWVRGMQLWLSVSAFQKVLLRCSLRYLTAISGLPTAVMCDALIDFLLAGSDAVPELAAVADDYVHALGHPNQADHLLLEGVLGAGALPEDRHLQAVVHAVIADPRRHLPLLREACGYLVERFGLHDVEGLSYLAGAMTLDAAGGSMYRAGLVHHQLRSVFAVDPAVLAVAIEAGDFPPLEHDPTAGVVHGSVTSAPERSSYPVSGYVLMLNKGTRKLLWDGEWSLFGSGVPDSAPPAPSRERVEPDRRPLPV